MTIENFDNLGSIIQSIREAGLCSDEFKGMKGIEVWPIRVYMNDGGTWCVKLKEWDSAEKSLVDEPLTDEAVAKIRALFVEQITAILEEARKERDAMLQRLSNMESSLKTI